MENKTVHANGHLYKNDSLISKTSVNSSTAVLLSLGKDIASSMKSNNLFNPVK